MESLKFEKTGSIARITLARPEQKNPLNRQFVNEMNECLDEIERDDAIKVVLLTGEGEAFCSGGDVKDCLSEEDVEMIPERNLIRDFLRIPMRMRYLDKPIITAVNGPLWEAE